jgi:hypothetical protein
MTIRKCINCGKPFRPRSQVPQQTYCSDKACQAARKRQWKQSKLHLDPDYRDNQKRSAKDWAARNPAYSRQYRASHPDYVDRNRLQQQERNGRRIDEIAKSAASPAEIPLPTGTYRLRILAPENIAKSDAWIVEITLIS